MKTQRTKTEEIITKIQHRLSQLEIRQMEDELETESDELDPIFGAQNLPFSVKSKASTTTIRKSTRKRFKRTLWWKNEYPVYDCFFSLVDVVRVPEIIENTKINNKIKKMRKARRERKREQRINTSDSFWKSKYENLRNDYKLLLSIQKRNKGNDN